MPTYGYTCQNCGHTFEIFQDVNEGKKKKCPECKLLKLSRDITGGLGGSVVQDPKTLLQQAERNTAKMGHYELQERRMADEEGNLRKRKPKEPAPWWRPGTDKPDMSLANLTPAQKQKYIETGEK